VVTIPKLSFIRYTHDENGNYRLPEEKPRGHSKEESVYGFCIHMLDSNRYMTFEEIYQEHTNYFNTFPEDGPAPDKSEVALALFKLMDMGWIKCRVDDNAT